MTNEFDYPFYLVKGTQEDSKLIRDLEATFDEPFLKHPKKKIESKKKKRKLIIKRK